MCYEKGGRPLLQKRDKMILKGRVAIITGGSRGIGEAIVKKFVKEGALVAFTFSRHTSLANKISKETKGKASGYRLDIKDYAGMKKLVAGVKKKFGRLDILVNNAGIACDKSLIMMEEKDWSDVIKTNLTGAFNASKACIVTFMKQKSGNIISISSLSGIMGVPGQTNYGASKAGLVGFTKALAKEVGPYKVRVNAIAPGFIMTQMLEKLKNRENILNSIPLRRFGLAEEVAELAAFLASDKSSYVTGETIIIDGGLAA